MAATVDLESVRTAFSESWAAETSAQPEQWTSDNPTGGHCEVASFVAWEHLGGELVLAEVYRTDGSFQEHHYWNRIDGVDIDFTREQFRAGEVITELQVLSDAFLRTNQEEMKPAMRERIARFRDVVADRLDSNAPQVG